MIKQFRSYLVATGYNRFNKFMIPVLITLSISVLEIIGIGLVYPILQFFLDTTSFEQGLVFKYVHKMHIGITLQSASLLLLSLFFAVTIFRGWFTYKGFKKIFDQLASDESAFATAQYKKLLAKDYLYFINNPSMQIIRDIAIAIPQGFSTSLQSAFLFLSESVVLIGMCVALLLTNYQAFLILTAIFAVTIVVYVKFLSPKITTLGAERHEHSHKTIGVLQQSIEGIQQIKNCRCENYFVQSFSNKRDLQADISSALQLIQILPKIYFETIMVSCVCFFLGFKLLFSAENMDAFIVLAGFYVVAAMRVLPSVLRMSAQYNNIISFKKAINVVIKLSQESYTPPFELENGRFAKTINIKDLNFSYSSDLVLQQLNMNINKNECIGIFGKSGQGKTTLINILVGLLHANKGSISIDEVSVEPETVDNKLSSMIAYVPQNIFLIDDSIRRNVAFGKNDNEIKDTDVLQALKDAALMDFVDGCPNGINTYIGERGARISGGQRQRLGIARALYTNRDVIIFDEATSSLDSETEEKICETIKSLKSIKTILIISHRKKPLTICDKVYKMESGKLLPAAMNNFETEIENEPY